MIEKGTTIHENDVEWIKVSTFGEGIIYALGDKRKIVTSGQVDFNYQIKPEPTLQTPVQST